MRRSGSPRKLWNFCGVWCAAIRRLTSMDKLDGRTPTEVVTGTTPDISQYAQFDWYEPIRFLDNRHAFPNETKLLGRFLGVAKHCTDVMAFRILTENPNQEICLGNHRRREAWRPVPSRDRQIRQGNQRPIWGRRQIRSKSTGAHPRHPHF
jgi:hypothetical protein